MTELFNKLLDFEVLYNNEQGRIRKKHGISENEGINAFDVKNIDYIFEKNPFMDKLEQYLETLNYKELLMLQTLLYYGRDEGQFSSMINYFKNRKDDKKDLQRTITEKIGSYEYYFKEAKKKLEFEEIHVEGLIEKYL